MNFEGVYERSTPDQARLPATARQCLSCHTRIRPQRGESPLRGRSGSQDVVGWFFDLDESGAPAHELKDVPDRSAPLYFADRTVTVAPGEAVTIDAIATTQTCECLWVLELDVVVEGRQRVVRIDNDGKPFHTSGGRPGVPEYIWEFIPDENNPSGFQQLQPDGSYAPAAP